MSERELYEKDKIEYGCGYWSVCLEHACPCHPTARVNQGFNIEVWNKMKASMEAELRYMYGDLPDDDWPLDYDEDDDFEDSNGLAPWEMNENQDDGFFNPNQLAK